MHRVQGVKILMKIDDKDIIHLRVRAVFDCSLLDIFGMPLNCPGLLWHTVFTCWGSCCYYFAALANEVDLWAVNSQSPMELTVLKEVQHLSPPPACIICVVTGVCFSCFCSRRTLSDPTNLFDDLISFFTVYPDASCGPL